MQWSAHPIGQDVEMAQVGSSGKRHRLPVFTSLQGYQKSFVTADLAGLTLLVIAIPEQLATSRLAGMPPITGFYAFAAGTLLFALLGSNPQMSVGADSTIAPLFAVGVAHLAASGTTEYIDLVGILAVMVGLIVALIGLLRLGWIAEFLSAPIITGFMAGVAIIIIVHQLPDFLGLPPPGGTNLHRVGYVLTHLRDVNGWTTAIGLGVLAVVVVSERIDRRLPGALLGLIGSTVLVGVLGLQAHGVAVLGPIAHGAPRLGLDGVTWSAVRHLAPLAAVVALVVVSQTAATTRGFADQGNYPVDVGRDFLGVGAGSILSGFIGSFPVNASPARTGAVANTGGRTQAACLGAAAAVILFIPAAGLLKDVPLATLAAVLIYVASRLFHRKDLRAIARFDRFELALAVITLLTVAFVGVEQGIAVAVGLAILDRTRITAQPRLQELGRVPDTTSWTPLTDGQGATRVGSTLVVLFSRPLWYANAEQFRVEVAACFPDGASGPDVFILDTIGMNDLDFTGCRALDHVLTDLERRHVAFGIARAGEHLVSSMRKGGLAARIGEDHFFATVNDAVEALNADYAGPQPPTPPAAPDPATGDTG
jgi:high affinity sulfate transporter 1